MKPISIPQSILGCGLAAVAALAVTPSYAALFGFTTADAPLPAYAGTGLNGSVWTGVDVDSLAAARSYVSTTAADATFTASEVDYPAGALGSLPTTTTFNTALGADAASLSSAAVGTTAVLNSILTFDGYLRVDAPGSFLLGVGSDDGSELVIQGTQVIGNDGIHPFPGASSGPVEVEFYEAGLFEIEILFFESQPTGWGIEFFEGSAGVGTPVSAAQLYGSLEPPMPPVPLPAAGWALALALGALGMMRRTRA